MRALVKVSLSPHTGYGNDGLGFIRTLMKKGVDVYIHPSVVEPPIPSDIAQLLTKELKPPFDLIIQHEDPARLKVSEEAASVARLVVGQTMWEMSSLNNLRGRSTVKEHLKHFNLILSYDQVSHDALNPYVPRHVKHGILQGGYDPTKWPFHERNWHNPERFVFSMVGQLHERKAPLDAYQAFMELQDEYPNDMKNVHLALKTSVAGLHPFMAQAVRNCHLYYETWDLETLQAFYRATHCLLAPSRGEGKHLPSLEMMSTGAPVIGTNWGGMASWMSEQYAYPLEYELQECDPRKFKNCKWAVVNMNNLKERMMEVVTDRTTAEEKGRLAAEVIPQIRSWDSVADRFFELIAEYCPDPGVEILQEYQQLTAEPRDIADVFGA